MKKVSLSGSVRPSVGKKDAADLRRAGNVPCVLYGGETQTSFSATEKDLKKIIWSPNVYLVNLDVDGTKKDAVIQAVQFHPVTDRAVHVDFLEIIPGKETKIKLPLKITGSAEGVKKGGKLNQNFRKIMVKGMIDKMPEAIEVNVDKLDIGDDIRVKDISIPGLTLLEQPSAVVAAVKSSRNVVADEPAATPAAAPAAATPEAKK